MIAWANVGHGGQFQAFPYGIAAELDAGAATRASLGIDEFVNKARPHHPRRPVGGGILS